VFHGHTPDLNDDSAFELVTATAEGQLDVEQIAARLAARNN
jgi:hypothetical protein